MTHEEMMEVALNLLEAGEDCVGICTECGYTQMGCEPDAEGIYCENCGEPSVMGLENFILGA